MRVQVFPLLAKLGALQLLCDEWLNAHVPRNVAVFRPALPVVLCSVLHYPEMGGEIPWRTGSLSQNEVYFLVPLERHREEGGRLRFVENAVATPYIFVDNPESAAAGRERFGMPKQEAQFSTEWRGLPWPLGSQRYMSISTWEPSVTGHRLGPLLDIVRHAASTSLTGSRDDDFLLPPGGRPNVATLLRLAPVLVGAVSGALGPDARDVAERLRGYLSALWSERHINLFSLRQFADPQDPETARYQDLVSFRMRVTDVQSLGLLGGNLVRPEFNVLVHRSEIHPIVRRLGLVVRQRHTGTHGQGAFEVMDAFMPFFAQADVELVESRRLCWRKHDAEWRDDEGRPLSAAAPAMYNRSLGPSSAAFLEPQAEPSIMDMKFLMLTARRERLRRFIERLMPRRASIELELLGTGELAAVRMLVYHSRPRGIAEQEELVWMDGTYLSISAPVLVHGRGSPFVGTVMLHDFTSNSFMVQALRELLAGPTSHAQFEFGVHGWFSTTHPLAPVLGMSTMAIERTPRGATVVQSPLLDVFAGPVPAADTVVPRREIDALRRDVWPVLSTILPIISIGAIASPHSPAKSVSRRVCLTEFDEPVLAEGGASHSHAHVSHVVRFHTNETYPIADALGLVAHPEGSPFAMKLHEGIVGRCHTVPVLAYAETAVRLTPRTMAVIWEGFRARSGRRAAPRREPP